MGFISVMKIFKIILHKLGSILSNYLTINIKDKEFYSWLILTIYFMALTGLFIQFVPYQFGQVLIGVVNICGTMYSVVEFDEENNAGIIFIFFLVPVVTFILVFMFSCGYWCLNFGVAILLTT
jgi:hypothetical protein